MKLKFKLFFTFLFISLIGFSQESEFKISLDELKSTINTVQTSKITYTQSLSSDAPGVIKYNVTETNTKGSVKEIEYEFNLADIDVNTIKPITSKDLIQVQLIADKNQKIIKQVVDNEKISFLNKINVFASDIDNARELSEIFKKSVPICTEIIENRLNMSGYEDRLSWLEKNIVNVDLIDKGYAQTLSKSDNVVGNVTLVSTLTKSKSNKTYHYQFNLANINPNSVFFKSNGSEFILKLETKRRLKTIKVTEDGEQKNYTNSIQIQCASVENARDLQRVIQDVIPLAQDKFLKSFPQVSNATEGMELINKKINTITSQKLTTQQSFTADCITTFNKVEESEKKKDDYIYDFNLIDINKEDIEVEVKGISVYVVAKSIAKHKFIKLIKNDELQNYTNKISFICNSVEDAYYARYIFKELVELCNNNYNNAPKLTAPDLMLKELEKNVIGVQLGKLTYEQKIEPIKTDDLNALRFTNVEVSDKKSKKNVQEFNLSDINSKSVNIKISGKKVMLQFATNYQEKIIKTYVDGVIKSYTNKVTIYCNTIENARVNMNLLKGLTKK